MNKTLITAVTALSLLYTGPAHAAEFATSITSQDWCISKAATDVYYPITGCKSLVVSPTTVVWNKPGEQATCAIRTKELLGGTHWWLTTSCQANDGTNYAQEFGLIEVPEHRVLYVFYERPIGGAVAPKTQ
jgi:hypothetical protein